MGSPPYADCRLYLEDGRDLGIARGVEAWVEWMLLVTKEALRVSRGAVVWVAAGKTKDRNYWPACEGLMWEWFKRSAPSGVWQDGIELPGCDGSMYRPCYWHRVGIPGSGGDQWFRADVEYAMGFKRPGPLPWSDNTACGHPPKWAPGGEMSHRVKDGDRRNQWGKHINCQTSQRKADGTFQGGARPSHRTHTKRLANGEMSEQAYYPPVLANPGNLIRTAVGGGQMGSMHAHENEAPYPEDLAEFFVKSLCPPGGITLDVFSGSGTTAAVADRHGRHGIGCDLRLSQCELGHRRITAGMKPVSRLDPAPARAPLPGQLELFSEVP